MDQTISFELTIFNISSDVCIAMGDSPSNDDNTQSDSDSVTSWHSCLDRPARPAPPQHRILDIDQSINDQFAPTPSTAPAVCRIAPRRRANYEGAQAQNYSRIQVAAQFAQMIYRYGWGSLTYYERAQLVLVFISVTSLAKALL